MSLGRNQKGDGAPWCFGASVENHEDQTTYLLSLLRSGTVGEWNNEKGFSCQCPVKALKTWFFWGEISGIRKSSVETWISKSFISVKHERLYFSSLVLTYTRFSSAEGEIHLEWQINLHGRLNQSHVCQKRGTGSTSSLFRLHCVVPILAKIDSQCDIFDWTKARQSAAQGPG